MQDKVKPSIKSEYGRLKTVILHQPGIEIDRLTPGNRSHLLFEDIPFLPKMQNEHQFFVSLLKDQGINVLLLENLLSDILINPHIKKRLVISACSSSNQPSLTNIILDNFSTSEIQDILLAGLTASEMFEKTSLRLGSTSEKEDIFILPPVPNAYFTRDPAAIIGNSVVSCKMNYEARVRETMIFQEIFKNHSLFQGTEFTYGANKDENRPFCIEGGDIIILNENSVAVGCSQRTRSESISRLAKNLFERGLSQRVYEINIPAERSYMHLDTVFTVVDRGLVVAYPDVMEDVKEIRRYEPMLIYGNEIVAYPIHENRTFNRILEEEFGQLEVIHTGNNNRRYAAREQLADGTNVFAIAPSMVVTYDRNIHTNKALEVAGVKVFAFDGSELVRGLGGPRCMTMPIERD